jgi:signal transduction histidine kinase
MRRNGSVFPCLVTIWQVDLPDDPAPLFMGILRDMTQYKDREAKLESLHRQFVDAARQAGKAEIATNVLHNVGNVLNSVNVSCGMIRDRVSKSPVSDLTKAIDVMKQYLDDLASYITQDKRGKHLPRFLIDLSQQIAADQQSLCQETQSLADNIEHVKNIIALQQSLAGVSALVERVRLADVVEEAIRIGMTPAASYPIEIVREFEEVPPMTVDRQKLLQILVNLMSNAKQALVDSGRGDKQVVVRILRTDDDRIRIDIQDNGVGILPENKARIFSHGFTTRKNGHGFGLHSAAIAVMEMGGELSVQSDGPGKGATFSLEIPIPYVDVAPSLVETLQPR